MGMSEESRDGAEWQEYRRAFELLRDRVHAVQKIAADPDADRARVDAALVEAEKARAGYNEARDRLGARLLPRRQHTATGYRLRTSSDVKEVAEILWELRGKPQGSAVDDWLRAEDILRRVTAV